MATEIKGKIAKIEFAKVKMSETVGKKKMADVERSYAHLTLDNGTTFLLTAEGGKEVEQQFKLGDKVKVTRDAGMLEIVPDA